MNPQPTVWGVDLSTHAVDLAMVAADGAARTCWRELHRDPTLDAGTALHRTRGLLIPWLRTQAVTYRPCVTYVELPVGKHGSPRLVMTAGLIADAIAETSRAPVYFISSSKWKKAIGLKGNAAKHDILAWAHRLGFRPERQDAADALGLAAFAALDMPGWVGVAPAPAAT